MPGVVLRTSCETTHLILSRHLQGKYTMYNVHIFVQIFEGKVRIYTIQGHSDCQPLGIIIPCIMLTKMYVCVTHGKICNTILEYKEKADAKRCVSPQITEMKWEARIQIQTEFPVFVFSTFYCGRTLFLFLSIFY